MYETEKENLKRFKDYIVEILRPSYIKTFLSTYLGTEIEERILAEENTSVTCAAEMLLQNILNLEAVGWFQAFLDELLAKEYTGLCEAIQEWDFKKLEEMRDHKALLHHVEASFTKHIKPTEVVSCMPKCFSPRECEEIKAITEQKGQIAGAEKLTECLKRSDKTNWFKLLKLALEERNFTIALQLLDPDTENSGKEVEDVEANGDTATVRFEYREDSGADDLVGDLNQMGLTENQDKVTGGSAFLEPSKPPGELKLRAYQRELAVPAFEGKNTIICAPTGSGKTIVALAISEHHLKSKADQKPKIVFMATKVDVYEQQYKLFKKHFNSTDQDVRITGLCGDMGEQISLDIIAETNDIIILTPQILVNALNRKDLPSLSVFSLLIFDECHNATRKHPYNVLMASYLDSKLSRRKESLPQIVGLTASVGVGTFKYQQEAENNICQLCANLDASIISTVSDNKEELLSFVYVPEKDFFEVEKRSGDPFIAIIHNIMSRIEVLAKKEYDIESLSHIENRDHGTQKYEQWIVDVQKRCKVLQLEDKEKESRVCRALFNYTEHLRKYNDALIINEDARTKDALDYLKAFFDQVRQAGFDETEQKLTACFDTEYPHLLQLSQQGQQNPKLEQLKYILDEEYRNDEKTRTVLFVRTRALADAMKNWIEETDTLKFLKPGVLIGRARKSNQTNSGMTLNSKKGVLESFKSSEQSKILIATSVADEGIDIPQCNLVLMYEYVGNVVKMIQVRGRGRAKGSKCFLISDRKERIEKEKLNILREKIVEKAIANLRQSKESMQAKIDTFQREDKRIRDHANSMPERPRTNGNFELLCAKCKRFACFSDDLRVGHEGSHHIVVERSIFNRCERSPHPNPRRFGQLEKKMKMFCKHCKNDWGIVATYMNIEDMPVIKIDSFVAQNCVTNVQHYFRKWKDVTFAIRRFDIADIKPF
nr:RIG-I [Anguilla anguilla]